MRVLFVGLQMEDLRGKFFGGTEFMDSVQVRCLVGQGHNVAYVNKTGIPKKLIGRYSRKYGCQAYGMDEFLDGLVPSEFTRPDLVFVSTSIGRSDGKLMKRLADIAKTIPTIVYGHGHEAIPMRYVPKELTCNGNVTFTVLNEVDKQDRLDFGVSSDRIVETFNTYDTEGVKRMSPIKVYDVLSSARPTYQKGVQNVARLCSELRMNVAYVGKGSDGKSAYYREIREITGRYGSYYGVVSHRRLLSMMGKSRFLALLPNEPEGMTLSVLEAMALGTPVITWSKACLGSCVDADRNIVLTDDDYVSQFKEEYMPNIEWYNSEENRKGLMAETESRFGPDAYDRQLGALIDMATK